MKNEIFQEMRLATPEELLLPMREGLEKFIKDNSVLGKDWAEASFRLIFEIYSTIYSKPYVCGESDFKRTNSYFCTAVSQFCPGIKLVTEKQLLNNGIIEKSGKQNGRALNYYIDLGIQVNGRMQYNSNQARALIESYKQKGIVQDDGKIFVPNYNQLELAADPDAVLVFKLKEDVEEKDLTLASEYPRQSRNFIRANGLFGVYMWDNGQLECRDKLDFMDSYGRVLINN